ncbi:beta-ketoacyl-[acyl-carrier-protein] synthase family protein [Dietzia timorensis]|uniref:beta-ketoacyl-[acyl-carrier-protein] synthase family protein n=1 Tax=Dietzia timorensis TaxID=499555 RepID=UPI0009EF1032|nr:beta-ketoacyl synthase N-terminal-like domain-containing protein [Dietzia timorensis]
MVSNNVVITGVGVALPGAADIDTFWAAVKAGRSAISPITNFDVEQFSTTRAGTVSGPIQDAVLEEIPRRLQKRMDRFSQLALSATLSALREAKVDVTSNPERIGVYMANMFGGWDITEKSLRKLGSHGYTGVSPYIASAWFPTAPQGQITIHQDLTGYSKTIIADTAGGALALGYAAHAVSEGRADIMLAGAAEAPVTPYTYTFCSTSKRLSPSSTYLPGDHSADQFCIGEGAVFFSVEREEAATGRGAEPWAQLAGFATAHVPEEEVFTDTGTAALSETITAALSDAGLSTVDVVTLDAQATHEADASELSAIHKAVGPDVPVTTAKPITGHLLGAAPGVDIANALLSLRHGVVAPVSGCENPIHPSVVTHEAIKIPLHSAAIIARGSDGTLAVVVLRSIAATPK